MGVGGAVYMMRVVAVLSLVVTSACGGNAIQSLLDREVRFGESNVTVDEGQGTVTLIIESDLEATKALTLGLSATGTAVAGVDYEALPSEIVIAKGQRRAEVVVTLLDDELPELSETLVLTLTGAEAIRVRDGEMTLSITDNDSTTSPTISISDADEVQEGPSAELAFTVTLSGMSATEVRVDYATEDGSATVGEDYTAVSGTLVFAPGETQKSVLVAVLDDEVAEDAETLTVELSNPTGATLADASGEGSIESDGTGNDLPSVSIDDVTVSEADGEAVFTVTLSNPAAFDIPVDFATADDTALAGIDYTAATGVVTILAGETTASLTVALIDDTLAELDETFFVDLLSAEGAELDDAEGVATLLADSGGGGGDDPVVSVADATIAEGGGPLVFSVTLSNASALDVTVDFATDDVVAAAGLDYTATSGTLTFAPGETALTVEVPVVDDTIAEPDETLTFTLSSPSNATLGDADATGTISADSGGNGDVPGLSITDVSVNETDATASLTVTLSSPSSFDVTVGWATVEGTASEGDDYVAGTGTLTFVAGDTSETVVVDLLDDSLSEPAETFSVALSDAVNAVVNDGSGTVTIAGDDTTGGGGDTPSISINDVTVQEDAETAIFTVTLSNPSSLDVSVSYTTNPGTALEGEDFADISGTLTFAANETTKQIVVGIVDDSTSEPDEQFTVALSGAVNATVADAQGAGTILGDENTPGGGDLPTVSIADITVNESTGTATFTVTMSNPSALVVSATYATGNAGDTAIAGDDYTSATGSVTFSAGETSKAITVTVNNDTLAELAETFTLKLTGATNATLGTATAVATISANDTPSLSIADVTVDEDGTPMTFTVLLSNPSTLTVTVQYATANNTASAPGDYTAASGTLTFDPNVTSKTFDVTVANDGLAEFDEFFFVNLTAATNATIADAQARGTITGTLGTDNGPKLSIANATASSEGGQLTFTVTLSVASAAETTVEWSTEDGTAVASGDYTTASGTLTFAPNDTSETITIDINDDTLGEPAETFIVVLANPVNAAIDVGQGTGTIPANDTPTLSINDVAVNESTGSATLTVSLSNASSQDVTVSYATANGTALSGSDYTAASGTLTFVAGDTSETITISLINDTLGEALETFVVNLSSPSSAATIGDGQGQITINASDTPTIAVSDISVAENVGTASFVVTLSNQSALTVTVDYVLTDGFAIAPGDYTGTSGTLTFVPGDVSENVVVAIINDNEGELDEDFFLDLSGQSNANLPDAQAKATILLNDTPTVSVGSVSVAENAGTAVFDITLSNPSSVSVSVLAATANNTAVAPGDYTSLSQTVTFLPGDTSETLPVTIIDNSTPEASETFFLNLSGPTNATLGTSQGTGTITNDDANPTIRFTSASQSASEAVGSVTVTMELSFASDLTVTAAYSVGVGSTATGSDYSFDASSPASPVSFSPGVTTRTLTINLVTDGAVEGSETLILNIGALSNASAGSPTTHTLTILDNDTPFVISKAETIDSNNNGYIDHYKLTFSKDVSDATFPGYVLNGSGSAQTAFLVAGASDVVLKHGTSAPETDTANDTVLYIGFTESSSLGTDATPDLTTTASPGLQAASGSALSQVLSASVTETDKAKPVLMRATTEAGLTSLNVFFSEPVYATGTCPSGTVPATAFIYNDDSVSGVSGVTTGTDSNACSDEKVVLAASSGTFGAGDIYVDSIQADPAQVSDVVGNFVVNAAVTITGIIHPYVLNVLSTSTLSARVVFSEAMNATQAATASNYSYTSSCSETPTFTGGTQVDSSTYDFTTSAQGTCTYRVTVTGDVRDDDENSTMVDPKFGTFQGNEVLRVVSAQARSLRTVLITFSKNVLSGSGTGGASNTSYYTLSSALGTVQSAVRYDSVTGSAADQNKVLVTHSANQGGAFYLAIVSTALKTASGSENLASEPLDRATFAGLGGAVTDLSHGALFTDPFADGTTFSFVFEHQGKIYAGTNDNNNAVFRFDPDGSNPVVVSFRISSAKTGGPFTSFGNSIERPSVSVTSSGGVTRYYLTPGTDLSVFSPGVLLTATGCTNGANNRAATATTAVNDASDYVEVSATGVTSTTETCTVLLYNNAGPGDKDGIDSFVSAPIASTKYLVFGAHNYGGGNFKELYWSADTDTVIDANYCSVTSVTLGNTESLQTIYGYGNYLYFGFASDRAAKPLFAHMNMGAGTCGTIVTDIVATNKTISDLAPLGGANAAGNNATNIGVDSIVVAGTTPALYLANNGGIAATTTLPPTGSTTWTTVRTNGDGVWTGTTQEIPNIGKLRPGEKGVPYMTQWGNYLFIARNRSDSSGVAEVWRYDLTGGLATASQASRWTKVVSSTDVGMNANNRDVSLLVVSGSRLYIGFDNDTNGAEVYRTKSGVTAATFSSISNLEQVGSSGLGPLGASTTALARNKHLISSAAASYNGSDYMYVTVGCLSDLKDNGACDRNTTTGATDFAIRMFRQVE